MRERESSVIDQGFLLVFQLLQAVFLEFFQSSFLYNQIITIGEGDKSATAFVMACERAAGVYLVARLLGILSTN